MVLQSLDRMLAYPSHHRWAFFKWPQNWTLCYPCLHSESYRYILTLNRSWLGRIPYFMSGAVRILLGITPYPTIVFLIKLKHREGCPRDWQYTTEDIVYYRFAYVSIYIKRRTEKSKTKLAS